MEWWTIKATTKLEVVYKIIPTIIMWNIWKRRNTIKHGGNVRYEELVWQCQEVIRKLIKKLYPWIKMGEESWPEIVSRLRRYKPRLHYCSVMWIFPEKNRFKCNTDGASRGNPGMSTCAFCIRDDKGDLVYAKAKGLGVTSNTQAEMEAIKEALQYLPDKEFKEVVIETNSLVLMQMINNIWKVPWELIEQIEDIRERTHAIQAKIQHTFREGNTVADALANEVIDEQLSTEYHMCKNQKANQHG